MYCQTTYNIPDYIPSNRFNKKNEIYYLIGKNFSVVVVKRNQNMLVQNTKTYDVQVVIQPEREIYMFCGTNL